MHVGEGGSLGNWLAPLSLVLASRAGRLPLLYCATVGEGVGGGRMYVPRLDIYTDAVPGLTFVAPGALE